MKPKTKNEHEVVRLSKGLPKLTKAQKAWIMKNAVPATAYGYRLIDMFKVGKESKPWAWCSNCGHEFVDDHVDHCPMCGAKFTKHEYSPRRRVVKCKWYTTIATTCKGWQVSRHYLVDHECRHDGQKSWHYAQECVQVWTNTKGEQVIMARPCKPFQWYYDVWNFGKPMTIQHKTQHRGYKYDINPYAVKVCRVLPIIRRNGFDGHFADICPDKLFHLLLTDNFAETLYKCRQYAMLGLYSHSGVPMQSVKICLRHGYIIKDADLWRDYIVMCEDMGKDVRNPKICCPADLNKAHDRVQKAKERRDRERELEAKRKTINEAEPAYAQRVGKYLGIVIKGQGITIQPLQSVMAFFEEGQAMHHCVFTRAYYKDKGSLILSARDSKGNRIETIELDIKSGRVNQSRGKFNKLTDYHDTIVRLVETNAIKFQKARRKPIHKPIYQSTSQQATV